MTRIYFLVTNGYHACDEWVKLDELMPLAFMGIQFDEKSVMLDVEIWRK